MAHGVFHKDLGPINLSELDLNDRADRLLWESLYGKTAKGDLECLECRDRDPGCPQYMFLRLWKGRPLAVHYSTARHSTAPESPRHRALKERIARAAENAGLTAELEARASDGRRRTDVLVHGENGVTLGCEVQLSYATAQAVVKRTDIARADGLTPLWTTDDEAAPLIERTPWARLDQMPIEAFSSGNALLVRGGVKDLKLTKCDSRNPVPCPDRNYGRCNKWHGTWAPTLGMHLDRLVTASAVSEYVPLYLPAQRGRRASHMWVSAQDREKYLDATTDQLADPDPGHIDNHEPSEPERLPLTRECAYQQRLDDKNRRGRIVRDTSAILPAGITLDGPSPPTSPPTETEARPATSPPTSTDAAPSASRQSRDTARSTGHQEAGPPPRTSQRATRTAPRMRDRAAAATQLGCKVNQVGFCATCQDLTRRYGQGGNPLCSACQEARRYRKV
ncbi:MULTISPECIES: hypothetical protein [Streptomyces]|uniref:competence protein CoiA family protein n=1 Tax=Streptomyces TaxID=1883 RepID=UPI00117E3AED|nr:hypothetical protein [Streptomyces kasugaensis]